MQMFPLWLGRDRRPQRALDDSARRLAAAIGLAAAVCAVYFLVADLSVALVLEPEGVAVFWPAAGITSGFLIALGPRARWPTAAGVIGASIAVHLAEPLWAGASLGLYNAAEALIVAGLIQRYFGADFRLDRLMQILGLLAAAVAGTVVSGVGGAVTYRLLHGPSAAMLTTWQHWFASDVVGIVAVAPLVIGLAVILRVPPRRSELGEGIAALAATGVMTGIIIFLSQESWDTILPIAWLLPTLLWLAARCRPVFAAAGAFIVSGTIVLTTIFGIGHFGSPTLSMGDRILEAQACIMFVAFAANVLAALFAERRENEARLANSNMLLERERDNKLMNLQAVVAAIRHEVNQPLTGITLFGVATLKFLQETPPKLAKAEAAVNEMLASCRTASDIFDNIRQLFGKAEPARDRVDVNATALEVLHTLNFDFNRHGVTTRVKLAPELPPVMAHEGQLREAITNLAHNAIEAMGEVDGGHRILKVSTERNGNGTIALTVEDTGPGLGADKPRDIFEAFVTTKAHGMGLGLAICQMIVERHGGQLLAFPAEPRGAIFRIVLPQADSSL
jgi:signal transduction histidine kinase